MTTRNMDLGFDNKKHGLGLNEVAIQKVLQAELELRNDSKNE